MINNAGISSPSNILLQSPEQVSKVFSTNTLSHFHLNQLFLKSLLASPRRLRRGGHIVTVSSVLGHLGSANLSAYTASKAALLAYHASLSAELAQSIPQIKTVLVAQGQLDTELFREVKVRGWLQRFTGPVIGAQEVALRIVKLLDEGRGGEVRTPFYAAQIGWMDVLPACIKSFLRSWSGVDHVVQVAESMKQTAEGKRSAVQTQAKSEMSETDSSEEEEDDDDGGDET